MKMKFLQPVQACIQAVDDNEETNSNNGEAHADSYCKRWEQLVPISIEQEAEQDAEIKGEDFGQAVRIL